MRIPLIDSAKEARTTTLIGGFRELLRARAMWAISGVMLLGLLTGLFFYQPGSPLPLTNQPVNGEEAKQSAQATRGSGAEADEELLPAHQDNANTGGLSSDDSTNSNRSRPTSSESAGPSPQVAGLQTVEPPLCDESAKALAAQTRQRAIQAENRRFSALGAVGSLLSLVPLRLPTSQEIKAHQQTLTNIEREYQAALVRAGCA